MLTCSDPKVEAKVNKCKKRKKKKNKKKEYGTLLELTPNLSPVFTSSFAYTQMESL